MDNDSADEQDDWVHNIIKGYEAVRVHSNSMQLELARMMIRQSLA